MTRRRRDTVFPALGPLDQRRAAATTPRPPTTQDAYVGPGDTLPVAVYVPQSFVGQRFRVGGASLAVPGRFRVLPAASSAAPDEAAGDADTVSAPDEH